MNLFGISSIILSLSGLLFSFLVFRSDTSSKVNRYWFISCISFSIWSFSLYIITAAESRSVATAWQYILDISAIFLPATYLLFLSEFLNLRNTIIRKSMLVIAGLLSIFSLTPLFKLGMGTLGEFYWVQPGPYYIIFPIYFVIYAVISLWLMIRAYIQSKDPNRKAQIRNLILGGIMGYGGGVTNFFPQIFSLYPFGNYLVIFYIVFMVYGVIRYKMLSAKVVSAQLFSTAIGLIALFNLLRSIDGQDVLFNILILVLVIIFSLLLVNSVNKEVAAREKIELLATDLEKANKRLTDLDRQKSEFVSFATHQLRAPLTAMKGYSSMLLEGDYGELPKPAKEGVSRIFESTNTLVSIVDDYLNVTRIELGAMKYAFETIDLRQLIEDVNAELEPTIKKSSIQFSFEYENDGMDFRITADRDKLKQVIVNLVDNALKYTPKGWIKTELKMDKQKHKFIYSVKDNGIGIAPEVLPRLFQKYTRAGNANKTNIKGTGLGLYVAREMVEAHHGTVHAESDGEGKGSTFIVEFEPFQKA